MDHPSTSTPPVTNAAPSTEKSAAEERTIFLGFTISPSPIQHSPMRILTITPLQQLFVMNSAFVEDLSAKLAKSVEQDSTEAAKVRDLYHRIFARDPAPNEIDLALSYLNRANLQRLAQALLATNEETFWQ